MAGTSGVNANRASRLRRIAAFALARPTTVSALIESIDRWFPAKPGGISLVSGTGDGLYQFFDVKGVDFRF